MFSYRSPPPLHPWQVEALVRVPLGYVSMNAVVYAFSETHAVEQHREDLEADGFEIHGLVTARKGEL
jgi:hypothetical protein